MQFSSGRVSLCNKKYKISNKCCYGLEATYLLLPPDEKQGLSAKQVLDFHKKNIFFKGNFLTRVDELKYFSTKQKSWVWWNNKRKAFAAFEAQVLLYCKNFGRFWGLAQQQR